MLQNTVNLLNDNGELKIIFGGSIVTPKGEITFKFNHVDDEGNPTDELLIFEGVVEGPIMINFRSIRINGNVYQTTVEAYEALKKFFDSFNNGVVVKGFELTEVEPGKNYTFPEQDPEDVQPIIINLTEIPVSSNDINIQFVATTDSELTLPAGTKVSGSTDITPDNEYLINIYNGIVFITNLQSIEDSEEDPGE